MKKLLAIALTTVFVLALATSVCAAPNTNRRWKSYEVDSGVIDPAAYYHYELQGLDKVWHTEGNFSKGAIYKSLEDLLIAEVADITRQTLSGLSASEIRDIAHKRDVTYYITEIDGLTDQLWAVQVETEPGESGRLVQDFETAYGPYGGLIKDADGSVPSGGEDKWFFKPGQDGQWQTTVGEDYVGNYFHMDQLAYTSDGTIRRYMSISSPWSHAFLKEDMSIEGRAEIADSFTMDNIAPGAEFFSDWWSMF